MSYLDDDACAQYLEGAKWRDAPFGRSPVVEVLPALRAWNDLPQEERVRVASAWVLARLYGDGGRDAIAER